jgi:hypothetical protein
MLKLLRGLSRPSESELHHFPYFGYSRYIHRMSAVLEVGIVIECFLL